MRKHWHVGNGSPGCMFDNVETFTSKRDAQKSMVADSRTLADFHREPESNYGVKRLGSAAAGLIQVQYGIAGAYNFELFSCTDAECLEED